MLTHGDNLSFWYIMVFTVQALSLLSLSLWVHSFFLHSSVSVIQRYSWIQRFFVRMSVSVAGCDGEELLSVCMSFQYVAKRFLQHDQENEEGNVGRFGRTSSRSSKSGNCRDSVGSGEVITTESSVIGA